MPLDINRSSDRYTVETVSAAPAAGASGGGPCTRAIRLSLAQLAGMSRPALHAIQEARERGGPFASLRDFCARVRIERPLVEGLIRAGAFGGLEKPTARKLLWELPRLLRECGEPFQGMSLTDDLPNLPTSRQEEAQAETSLLGFSLDSHPLSFCRAALDRMGVVRSGQLARLADGVTIEVAGQVVAWQTPPTKSGQRVVFLTMEDEDGLLQVVIFPKAQEKCLPALHMSPLLLVQGTVQHRGKAITMLAQEIRGITSEAGPAPLR